MKNKNGGGSVNTGGETAAAASGPMAMGKALISRNFSPQKSNGNRLVLILETRMTTSICSEA